MTKPSSNFFGPRCALSETISLAQSGPPQEMESASAMYIAVLQLGLASGAFLGGFAVDRIGLIATLVSAGIVCLGTAAMAWLFGRDDRTSDTSHAVMPRRAGAVED